MAAIASAARLSCNGTVTVEPTAKASSPAIPSRPQDPSARAGVAVDAELQDLAAEVRESAAGVPSATISPAWMIATRSHSRSASSR